MRINKMAAAVAFAAVAVAGTGVAYAYWTTTGSGTGTAAGAVPQASSAITFAQNNLTPMFPGDSLQSVTTAVTNTGTQNAYVTNVKAYLTVVKPQVENTATPEPGDMIDKYAGPCGADDFLLGDAAATAGTVLPATGAAGTATALTWTAVDLAKTNGTANATGQIAFNNKGTTNQDGCKEAAVTVHYVAS